MSYQNSILIIISQYVYGLLHTYYQSTKKNSLDILKEIANMKIRGSLDAEMTIQEWKNGNLRNFYTL